MLMHVLKHVACVLCLCAQCVFLLMLSAAASSKVPVQRTTDLYTLVVLPDGQLLWSSCDSPAPGAAMPDGEGEGDA